MVFSSVVFLCVFLPVTFVLYTLVPSIRIKNALLIIASLIFYAYGEPVYVLLMLFSSVMNYVFGIGIAKTEKGAKRKGLLIADVSLNLLMLGVFKYASMAASSVNAVFGTEFAAPKILLPIGISFYTFQILSYVIDVYFERVDVQRNYFKLLLYISFFPQLIAGPIVKYRDISAQIDNRQQIPAEVAVGLRRFITGLAKKVLIANVMGLTADRIYSYDLGDVNFSLAWIAAIAFMLQIFFDFSGYSDMAIGLGRMFGFHYKENFNHPYAADSMKDFWRRWHISLSSWFRDYLYIPLGGNRKGRVRTCINKLIVFFLTGLWHGANWTFVIWGLYHGLFLLMEEYLPKLQKIPCVIRHAYVLVVTAVGFVFFRADTIEQALYFIKQMFSGFFTNPVIESLVYLQLDMRFLIMSAIGIVCAFPVRSFLEGKLSKERWAILEKTGYIVSILLLLICLINLSGSMHNPFIYFRF